MALPTSGNIDQLAINAEFGAPANTPLASMLRGGAFVPDTPTNAGVPTALPISMTDFYGASAAPALGVNVTDHNVQGYELLEPGPTYDIGSAQISVKNNGKLNGFGENGGTPSTDYAGEWLTGGSASDIEVRATLLSGALTTGSTGVWLNCGTTRTWVKSYGGVGTQSCSIRLEFRRASDGVVLDTCDISLSVSRP